MNDRWEGGGMAPNATPGFVRNFSVFIFSVFIYLYSASAHAWVDCTRPINKLWTGHNTGETRVYVIHGDGYPDSLMRPSAIANDDAIMDRVLSVILYAKTSNKTVTFRFDKGEDNSAASCTPTVRQIIIGAWINF
jgi:hypothetical protein